MSTLSAAKVGAAKAAAPKVNRLLMAPTVALVFFIDALLRLNDEQNPVMLDKTGPLSQLFRRGVPGAAGLKANGSRIAAASHEFACRMEVYHYWMCGWCGIA